MPIELELTFDILPEISDLLENRTRKIVQKTCRAIKTEAKRSIMDGPKSGEIYKYGPSPVPHQASAPGEAPANWTEVLVESIHYTTSALGTGEAEGEVRVDSDHGLPLETGTVKMEARPFMVPAADKIAPAFAAAMEALTSDAFDVYMAALEDASDPADEEAGDI